MSMQSSYLLGVEFARLDKLSQIGLVSLIGLRDCPKTISVLECS